jgi:hypothetical protein
MDGQGHFAALLAAAITDKTADRSTLLRLSAASWPGRDDRTVPVGREWVRAWGPRPMPLALPNLSFN